MKQPTEIPQIEYDVLSAILQSKHRGQDGKALLISECVERHGVKEPQAIETFRRIFEHLEIETIHDFVAKDTLTSTVEPRFVLETPCAILSNDEAEALSRSVGAGSFHQAIYAKYPDVDRITYVSRVGFNPSMTEAIAHVGWQSGPRAGLGTYYWVQKTTGGWAVRQSHRAWIS